MVRKVVPLDIIDQLEHSRPKCATDRGFIFKTTRIRSLSLYGRESQTLLEF